jgi:hypothetical protein
MFRIFSGMDINPPEEVFAFTPTTLPVLLRITIQTWSNPNFE